MKKHEPIRFVYFADGREISRKQAESGKFVLCAYSEEPDAVYAFDHDGSPELVARWAQERGIRDKVAATDAELAALPADPSDEAMAVAATAASTAVSTVTIHELQDLLTSAATAQLTASTTDVRRNGLAQRALSARVEGSIAAYFYREIDYGPPPARWRPVYRQVGPGAVPLIPFGAKSVIINLI